MSEAAVQYHSGEAYRDNPVMNQPGKISVMVTKGCETQDDLALAYTPHVGAAVTAIAEDEHALAALTGYGNKGAVISDGSAILGLGNLGPKAATPVMEGKSVLFKVFGDVNMDALMINEKDPAAIVDFVMKLEPTYAGINLEDISAPRCFEIEEELQKRYKGFVFHDDQHGTAVISLAGLLNALDLQGRDKSQVSVVINGAGAAAIACGKLYKAAGITNIVMLDRNGVIYKNRPFSTNKYKEEFAVEKDRLVLNAEGKCELADALKGVHVFIGCSVAGVVTGEMVASMAEHPIIMAMANPDPEILPDVAKAHGAKIVATGRSDFPNQINNVLGFPGIFRGALDALITRTTTEIKLAAAYALRDLAHQPVPEDLKNRYPEDHKNGLFEGADPVKPDYIVPLALDTRVAVEVAAAVYKAAFDSGVAGAELPNGCTNVSDYLPEYKKQVAQRLINQESFRQLYHKI